MTEEWVQARLADCEWIATARAAAAKPELVHEVPERAAVAAGQSAGQARGAFSRGDSRAWPFSMKRPCWRCAVYIDLNPVAARVAETPETSDITSIKERVDHVEAGARPTQLAAAKAGSVAGSQAAAGLEESQWLCPIEDRRGLDSCREGMIQGFPLGSYLKLVDYTGRLFRQGKASISSDLAGVFERLGCSAMRWQNRLEKLSEGRLLGRFFAASRARLREIRDRLGMKLRGQPGRLSLVVTRLE